MATSYVLKNLLTRVQARRPIPYDALTTRLVNFHALHRICWLDLQVMFGESDRFKSVLAMLYGLLRSLDVSAIELNRTLLYIIADGGQEAALGFLLLSSAPWLQTLVLFLAWLANAALVERRWQWLREHVLTSIII